MRLFHTPEKTVFEYLDKTLNVRNPVRLLGDKAKSFVFFKGYIEEKKMFFKVSESNDASKNEFHYARILYNGNRKNFVEPYFCRSDGHLNVIGFEFIDGTDLGEILHKNVPTIQEKSDMLKQIREIFLCLKKSGVVHRDIRPGNFMVEESGRVLLVDMQSATDRRVYEQWLLVKKLRHWTRERLGRDLLTTGWYDDTVRFLEILKLFGADDFSNELIEDFHSLLVDETGVRVARKIWHPRAMALKFLSCFVPKKEWRRRIREC